MTSSAISKLRRDRLDVVVVLQRVDQLTGWRALSSSTSTVFCGFQTSPASLRRRRSARRAPRAPGRNRRARRRSSWPSASDCDIGRAGLQRRLEHGRRRRRPRPDRRWPTRSNMKATLPVSPSAPPCLLNAARTSRGGAVAVVGQRLDDDRDAARAVALVADLLVVGVVVAAGGALDRALDVVLGHVGRARGAIAARRRGLCVGIRHALARGNGDLAAELGEMLGALGVLRALAVHDVLNLEWPAIGSSEQKSSRVDASRYRGQSGSTIPHRVEAVRHTRAIAGTARRRAVRA